MSTNGSRIGFVRDLNTSSDASEVLEVTRQLDCARRQHTAEVRERFQDRVRYLHMIWSLGVALALAIALLLYAFGPTVAANRHTIERSVLSIAAYPFHFFAGGWSEFCRTASYEERRFYECPTPTYTPLPAPVVPSQSSPEIGAYHNTPLIPDQGIRDEAYEPTDKWLGAMTRADRLEGTYLVFKGDYTFERNFFGWSQIIFVRHPDLNISADVVPACSEGQAHDSSLHIDMEYVVRDVFYNADGTVRGLRLLGTCGGWEQ